jgi:hypothetical protein
MKKYRIWKKLNLEMRLNFFLRLSSGFRNTKCNEHKSWNT